MLSHISIFYYQFFLQKIDNFLCLNIYLLKHKNNKFMDTFISQFELAGVLSGMFLVFILFLRILISNDSLKQKIRHLLWLDSPYTDRYDEQLMYIALYALSLLFFAVLGYRLWFFVVPLTIFVIYSERSTIKKDMICIYKKIF